MGPKPKGLSSKEDQLAHKVEIKQTQEMLEEARKLHNKAVAKTYGILRFCYYCKAHGGPCQMFNTSDCHCYDKDGKPLGAATGKPFNSKKPYKKLGGNKQMAFMQTMFEAYAKAKKASKSKSMTLVTVLAVNRELDVMTRDFV